MKPVEKKKTTWQKVRKLFNDLHLWMGLASGLIVIVICFSGTAWVFNTEFREMATPELYKIDIGNNETPLAAEDIIKKVEAATGGKVGMLRIAADKGRPWHVSVKKKADDGEKKGAGQRGNNPDGPQAKEKVEGRQTGGDRSGGNARESKPKASAGARPAQEGRRPNMGVFYAVNQYTGEIIGDVTNTKNGTTEFMSTMFSLHRWLLLDRIEEPLFGELPNRKLGSYISGTATVIFTLGLLTGLVIWFPQKVKAWKQGLFINWRAKWKRINHDLHNTLAFYSFILLLVMGLTGPQWSFEWYREGLQKTLGTYRAPDSPRPESPSSKIPPAGDSLVYAGVTDYIAAVNAALPYTGDLSLNLPADSTSVVMVSKTRVGFFAPVAADRISLDQYTAGTVSSDIFRDKPVNERIAGSIKALHVGDVYGKFTKILYFLSCLIATSLPVTGTIIWINKLKKKEKRTRVKERKVQSTLADVVPGYQQSQQ